jgi:fluoride ion exporter CrcB/FEX
VHELVWTAIGAAVGATARTRLVPAWPAPAHSPVSTFVLASAASALVAVAIGVPHRRSLRAGLLAAGGTAGSVSAIASHAALSTPTQLLVGVLMFFLGALTGHAVGVMTTSWFTRAARERY